MNTEGNARSSSKTEAIKRFQYHQAREKLKDESVDFRHLGDFCHWFFDLHIFFFQNVGAAEDELETEQLWHEVKLRFYCLLQHLRITLKQKL